MKKTASKGVAEVNGTAHRMISVVDSYTDRIEVSILNEFRHSLPEGETLPDVKSFLEHLSRCVKYKQGQLAELDHTRVDEVVEARRMSAAVDEAETLLRRRVRFARNTMEETYGEPGAAATPFRASEAKTLDGLINQTEYLIRALEAFQAPPDKGARVSSALNIAPPPGLLAASLRTRIEALQDARKQFDHDRRDRHAAQVDQRKALEEFQHDIAKARNLLKALLRFGGLEDLAGQLDPPKRSSGTSEDPPTVEQDATPEAELAPAGP